MNKINKMKIFLVRHGETIENSKGIIQSFFEGKLSPLGEYQSEQLALRLKNEKIDKIFSSDLKRAVDTAKYILKYQKNCNMIFPKN